MNPKTKIFIALSGGIDSAVSAFLLKEKGFDVSGIFMRHSCQPTLDLIESQKCADQFAQKSALNLCFLKNDGSLEQRKYSAKSFLLPIEAAQAIQVASILDIPMTIFDADPIFANIIDYFVSTYLKGQTPNPCVLCNRILKFGKLVPVIQKLGGDYFATGHYVHIALHSDWLRRTSQTVPDWLKNQASDQVLIERGHSAKDQSYVLYGIDRQLLSRICFPIGFQTKEQIRQKAQEIGLSFLMQKKESQEICFVADREHSALIQRLGDGRETKGHFVSPDGTVLGAHQGYERYTIGQRKGLGMGFGERIFVQKIDPERCEVVLGPYEMLARQNIHVLDSRWHLDIPRHQEIRCDVKVRYRNVSTPATIWVNDDDSIDVNLDEPRFGVAPGQSLVCYFENRLLGGGIICE
ncbi:MAG: tRNA 2-thiouridine(34) synthase MnmA [Planctomycetia bacterium]|nr:tRNA 2-thiouridine(34) synthase MnmA [Planctomycetia bacterium]